MEFEIESRVRHTVTRQEYWIEATPDRCRIEATGEPAYAYRSETGVLWISTQDEMEDGRFVAAD